jgi:3-dehydroquinate dehydratase-2
MRILLINGPNLNTLGRREPEIYGADTLFDIVTRVEQRATELGSSIIPFQSNHEGAIIDFIQEQQASADGMIINAGGLSHSSVSLRDAISGSRLPAVEVHISNVYTREAFRHRSMLTAVCKGLITGLGWRGYIYALDYLLAMNEGATPEEARAVISSRGNQT